MNSIEIGTNKKNDWAYLFTFNSFTQYLNTKELLDISQLCKFIRLKLKFDIYKTFDISKFLNDKLKDFSISKSSKKFDVYRSLALYFKDYGNFINDLYLTGLDIDNYIDLHELSLIKITTISFCNLIIPSAKFNLILSHSNFLKYLRIKKLSLTYLGHDKSEYPIQFPTTLKSLDINKCRWVDYSQMTRLPMGSYTHQSPIEYDFHSPSATSLQHLPNLIKLVLADNRSQYSEVLANFLLNNQQLKHLHTGSSLLTQSSLNLLEGLSQLKELTLDNCISNTNWDLYQIPKLSSIRSLKFKHIKPDNIKIVETICEKCPFATKLYLDSSSSVLPNLLKIIQKQANLEYLKIKLIGSISELNLISVTLKSLVINTTVPELKLGNINNNCVKLDKIKIESKRLKSVYFDNLEDYRLISFNNSINYYKT